MIQFRNRKYYSKQEIEKTLKNMNIYAEEYGQQKKWKRRFMDKLNLIEESK